MLIRAFNRLKDDGNDIILLVVGSGFEMETGLLSLARNHIHFLGAKANVMDYLYASDAFCLSSVTEGMPISLIEAMACGCIPVCTPVGGILNTIQDGVTGFLSKSISEDDFLDALKRLIREKDTIDRQRIIDYSYSNFSIGKCSEKYLELYEGL
jgi:glycosyltransferase involved in cell wall biosynthesis